MHVTVYFTAVEHAWHASATKDDGEYGGMGERGRERQHTCGKEEKDQASKVVLILKMSITNHVAHTP